MPIFNMIYGGGEKPQPREPTSNTIIYMEFEQEIRNLAGTAQPTSSGGAMTYDSVGGQYVIKATGSGSYIEYSPSIQSIGTGDFTVSCRYYPIHQTSSAAILWNLERSSSPRDGITVRYDGTGGVDKIAFATNGADLGADRSIQCNLNQWNHVVMTRVSGVCKCYINGVNGLEFNSDTDIPTSGAFRVWSRSQSNQSQKSGAMGDKFIFENVAWTAREVLSYYNNTKSIYGL